MQITKVKCPESKYSIKCPYAMQAEFVIVHNTYNDASAMAEISYMIGNNNKVSFHGAVDDYRAVEGIDFNRNTFNAGDGRDGKGNRKGIAIEICYSKSGGEKFDKAEKLAAQYIAYLLKQRGWGIDKVKKHQDFASKYCPHRTLDRGWQRFLKMVEANLNGNNATVVTPSKKSVLDIAKEVIDGNWGTGEDRKKRLEKAGYNYREVQNKVNELISKNSKPSTSYYKACNKKYNSLVDALKSIGVDSSYNFRKKIATKNNIHDYSGTAKQNKQILDKLKAGRLIKV